MLVNDFDDERTLEEAEALEEQETQNEEIDNLKNEQDMPLEELLALYGNYGQRVNNEETTNGVNNTIEEVNEEEPDTEGDTMEIDNEVETISSESEEILHNAENKVNTLLICGRNF